MACPCFYPGRRLGPPRSIVPLGDLWSGQCRAPGREPASPDRHTLLERCNLGYARGKCAWFPEAGCPDAVRFTVARDSGSVVSIACMMERDYLPCEGLAFDYDTARGAFTTPPADRNLERQAAAYVASYLLRKQTA